MSNPTCRHEIFMNAIATGCECPIEPVTREEMILAAHAKREASGGGSGGVSSWNDLTDKPFGKEIKEFYVYNNEEFYSDSKATSFRVEGGSLVLGREYTVVIGNQTYKCVAKEDTENDCISCGNTTLWCNGDFTPGGEDTGEPFIFSNRWNNEDVFKMCLANPITTPTNFSISTVGELTTPIPDELIPESVFKNGDSRFCLTSPSGDQFWFMVDDSGELVPWSK